MANTPLDDLDGDRVLREQPLLDYGWRLDYERNGIGYPGQFFTFAQLKELGCTLRKALHVLRRLSGVQWRVDRQKRRIAVPDEFIPLAELKEILEALGPPEPGREEAVKAARARVLEECAPGGKHEGERFLPQEAIEAAVSALEQYGDEVRERNRRRRAEGNQ
jgi:hypothetical protein